MGWARGPTQQRASVWPCAAGALLCQGFLVTFCPTKSNKGKSCYQDRKGKSRLNQSAKFMVKGSDKKSNQHSQLIKVILDALWLLYFEKKSDFESLGQTFSHNLPGVYQIGDPKSGCKAHSCHGNTDDAGYVQSPY